MRTGVEARGGEGGAEAGVGPLVIPPCGKLRAAQREVRGRTAWLGVGLGLGLGFGFGFGFGLPHSLHHSRPGQRRAASFARVILCEGLEEDGGRFGEWGAALVATRRREALLREQALGVDGLRSHGRPCATATARHLAGRALAARGQRPPLARLGILG